MFPNNEPFGNIDLEEICTRMLSELSWTRLQGLIQSNSRLYKRCTVGGHRFTPKHRKRFEKIILQEAQKQNFDRQFCNNLFAYWYPLQEKLYNKLEEYFHSDEYQQYKEQQDISDEIYAIPDEKFEEFFEIEEIEQWRIVLCFSPLEFTREQAERILNESEKSSDLVSKIQNLENDIEQLRKDRDNKERELENLQERYNTCTEELQELRQTKRSNAAEIRDLQNKFKSSQAENKNLRQQLEEKNRQLAEKEQEQSGASEKEMQRLKQELQAAQNELTDWKTKYETQAARNRELAEEIEELNKKRKRDHEQIRERDQSLEELNSFATLICNRIDWPQVGAQMKLSPALKQQFNSLLKKLNYEEDRTLSLGDTLPGFWNSLQETENNLIDNVAQSETKEVETRSPEQFWEELSDTFNDTLISLEARSILLRMLREIFYQTFEMEDLKAPVLPVKSTAAGRRRSKKR